MKKIQMVVIIGGKAFFIKFLLIIMNKKTGKWSALNLILLNLIKRKITGKKNWLLTLRISDSYTTNNDGMAKNSGPGNFIQAVAKQIAIGAILLKQITLLLHYINWKKRRTRINTIF